MPIKLRDLFEITAAPSLDFIKFLQETKFIKSENFCPKCKGKMKIIRTETSSDGFRWQCHKAGKIDPHKIHRSLRNGTWCESSHLTMQKIVLLSYMWIHQFSMSQASYELNIVSDRTSSDWYKFFRDVCEAILLKKSQHIGGPEKIVEINAYKVKKKKCNIEKPFEAQGIFGGVERGSDKCFFVSVSECSALTFLHVIKRNVLPGTTVYSNCWETYNCLEMEEFNDLKVEFALTFINSELGHNTNKCKSMWGQVKRKVPARCWNTELYGGYLSEFVYRKTLQNVEDKFLTFIADMAIVYLSDDSASDDSVCEFDEPDIEIEIIDMDETDEPDIETEVIDIDEIDEPASMAQTTSMDQANKPESKTQTS